MRKTYEELEQIKKENNVETLWSWSRINTYKNDPYGYYLKYIRKIKEDRQDSIYTISGSVCHDILEKYYNGKIKQEDMIDEYEDSLMTMNLGEFKYDRNDEEKNKLIADKYEGCIKHFFRYHQKPENLKMATELFCLVKIADNIMFNGYIDNFGVCRDANGEKHIVITDYKTSTIYKGEKLEKESGQLYLYAEGVRQKTNMPLDHISIRYLFMKYVNVKVCQANGKWKERQIERNQIGSKLVTSVRMWLNKLGYNAEDYINDILLTNCLDSLPEKVQEKFIIEDCYVYLPLNEQIIDNLKQDIIKTVSEIENKEKEYSKAKDGKVWWTEITASNEYFFNCLSGYSRKLHKPYDEYMQKKEMFANNLSTGTTNDNDEDDELLELLENL